MLKRVMHVIARWLYLGKIFNILCLAAGDATAENSVARDRPCVS
jgi:hypothetical protein